MGYFPNSTSWEFWAPDNCFKCAHWPRTDDDPPCAVEMAHMLHNYEQGDDGEACPVRSILSMLIPRKGIENERCAMFKDRDGLTEKHLRDWQKYKALMAERDAAQGMPSEGPRREGGSGASAPASPVPAGDAPQGDNS